MQKVKWNWKDFHHDRYTQLYGSRNTVRQRIFIPSRSLVPWHCTLWVYGWLCTVWRRCWRPTSNLSINHQKSSEISQTHERLKSQLFHQFTLKQKSRNSNRRFIHQSEKTSSFRQDVLGISFLMKHDIMAKTMKPKFEIPRDKLIDLDKLKVKTRPVNSVLKIPTKTINRKDLAPDWDSIFWFPYYIFNHHSSH